MNDDDGARAIAALREALDWLDPGRSVLGDAPLVAIDTLARELERLRGEVEHWKAKAQP
jgi:hypothetical protein